MLKELIRYTELADAKMIDTFHKAGKPMPEAERLFSHILNSQYIWVSRIRREMAKLDRFDLHDIKDFAGLHQQNISGLLHLAEESDLSTVVEYSNSKGEKFADTIFDILFHVVNHSTYHRAQVATQFRINGITPPVTDYIFLKRQGEL